MKTPLFVHTLGVGGGEGGSVTLKAAVWHGEEEGRVRIQLIFFWGHVQAQSIVFFLIQKYLPW